VRERGYTTALLAGGEKLHNAFLERDRVDELLLNVVPTLEDEGLKSCRRKAAGASSSRSARSSSQRASFSCTTRWRVASQREAVVPS
jgi:riboflavin biosynthesis pyrimidine reductase